MVSSSRITRAPAALTLLTKASPAAAGPLVREEVYIGSKLDRRAHQELTRSSRILMNALVEAPKEESLAVPLLVLLAQEKQHILTQRQCTHLKMLCDQLDKCHLAFLQVAEVLQRLAANRQARAENSRGGAPSNRGRWVGRAGS